MSELKPASIPSASPDCSGVTANQVSGRQTRVGRRYSLRVGDGLRGRSLLVVGGNGFVGKVFLSMLLKEYSEVGTIYLLLRASSAAAAHSRLWDGVLASPVFEPLREAHGEAFADFCGAKIVPIVGDVSLPDCGIEAGRLDEMVGKLAAIVNISGVIDFHPPLDDALAVNALGGERVVNLARKLGNVAILHTSTCYVAGNRNGIIGEEDPRMLPPEPHSASASAPWDARRELRESRAQIAQTRARFGVGNQRASLIEAERALQKSHFRESIANGAESVLLKKALHRALVRVGARRAAAWGFSNTYTYTKALGEHLVASSGLRFTIVRPAVVESAVSFPFPGWNEGANTSAPLIYLVREGGMQVPASRHNVDIIPCDLVATGMILALAELIEGSAPAVYQLGTSDCNPSTARSFMKLATRYKRRYQLARVELNWVSRWAKALPGVAVLSERQFWSFGPPAIAAWAGTVKAALERIPAGALFGVADRWSLSLGRFAQRQRSIARVLEAFLPFIARHDYRFTSANVRAAYARLTLEERMKLPWIPESIDWSQWFFDVHVKGLERWVFPSLDALTHSRNQSNAGADAKSSAASSASLPAEPGLAKAMPCTDCLPTHSRAATSASLAESRCSGELRENVVLPVAPPISEG